MFLLHKVYVTIVDSMFCFTYMKKDIILVKAGMLKGKVGLEPPCGEWRVPN